MGSRFSFNQLHSFILQTPDPLSSTLIDAPRNIGALFSFPASRFTQSPHSFQPQLRLRSAPRPVQTRICDDRHSTLQRPSARLILASNTENQTSSASTTSTESDAISCPLTL